MPAMPRRTTLVYGKAGSLEIQLQITFSSNRKKKERKEGEIDREADGYKVRDLEDHHPIQEYRWDHSKKKFTKP